jgi:predicted metal-dependent phosphoesterase TrpH
MRWFKADLHIHTVLSPCGGLDMSPVNIIRQAVEKKLDIIAITDHNSTRHCRSAQGIAGKYGITVLAGAELNTKEEIHCLAFFENIDKADQFQQYIDHHLTVVANKPEIYGHQYLVDENEDILDEEDRLLVASLQTGIEDVIEEVHRLEGLVVPAHINRMYNGIFSQLGFLPDGLMADALELDRRAGNDNFYEKHPEIGRYPLLRNSDAHSLQQIGMATTEYWLDAPVFSEIKQVLSGDFNNRIKSL